MEFTSVFGCHDDADEHAGEKSEENASDGRARSAIVELMAGVTADGTGRQGDRRHGCGLR